MREILLAIASLAGAAVLTALVVLIHPESPLWKWMLWLGIAIFVACAAILFFDYYRPGGSTLLQLGCALGLTLFIICAMALIQGEGRQDNREL
jgi:hypothetical protein